MSRVRLVLLALACFLFTLPALAQFNASIQGTVTDPTGAVVPNAQVTATNQATGVAQTQTTDASGLYRISHMAPGNYTVAVSAASFKDSIQRGVVVLAETPRGLNVTLQPGQAAEQVTVTAGGEQLQTETVNNQGTINTQEIINIPQPGRDPYELVRTVPGVFGTGARFGNSNQAINLNASAGPGGSSNEIFQTENQIQVSANGQRISANNVLVDGVSVNSLNWGGAAVVTPNQESVSEITVVASNFDAENGRNSGIIVKTVSKNGTNNLHGSGIILGQDPGLNAFNKFYGPTPGAGAKPLTCTSGSNTFTINASQCPERAQNKYRQFAGSLGGPIVKDHLFAFFSYEGIRSAGSTLNRSVPLETPQFEQYVIQNNPKSLAAQIFQLPGITPRYSTAQKTVDCCSFDGRAVGTWYQAGTAIGQAVGNGPDGIPDWGIYDVRVPNSSRGNQYNGRLDFDAGKNQFFGSTYVTFFDTNNGGIRPLMDVTNSPTNSVAAVGWTRTLTNSLLNDLRGNFTRFAFNQLKTSGTTDYGLPQIRIFDFDIGGFGANDGFMGVGQSGTTPGALAQNTFEIRDTLSWVVGKHAFRFGAEGIKEQNNDNESGQARPQYQFRGLLNFANDACCFFEQVGVNPTTGGPVNGLRHFRTGDYAVFAQDAWKLRPNLTLTLGLRWEYFTPITETNNLLSNYILGAGVGTGSGLPCDNIPGVCNGAVKPVTQLYNGDKNNFAPKVGFTWSPAASGGNTVLRGGVALAYNRDMGVNFSNVRQNTPNFALASSCCFFDPGKIQGPPPGSNILYAIAPASSPFGFPTNPGYAFGVAPDGALCSNAACTTVQPIQIFGAFPNEPNPYVYLASLELQQAFGKHDVLKIGYSGSRSRKLLREADLNRLVPGDGWDGTKDFTVNASPNGIACGATNPQCPAPFQVGNARFSQIFFAKPDVNASYDSLITSVTHSVSYGLTLVGAYTWGHSIDTASFDFGASSNQFEQSPQIVQKSNSDYDVRNYFQLSAVWDVPWLRNNHSFAGFLLGGWTISTIATHNSGFPFTAYRGCCDPVKDPTSGDDTLPDLPFAYFGGIIQDPTKQQFINGIFPNPKSEFDITTKGIGCRCRNIFRGPSYSDVDLSLAKSFLLPKLPALGENARIEFRADAFNAFNILNLSAFGFSAVVPGINNATSGDITNTNQFGKANTAYAGRTVELQARFQF
ncbi:MAG: TonB-dependent receptor [Acidobacteria bacterium]|nr:TonB-dependent receptor [Acidobacteriota bacterium]MBV9147202.1 TonB-dependent receptor [Acidobacteriota bacterium]MBV9437552.1 TonB-dependent receptor [Acidobacteriota bacterium]